MIVAAEFGTGQVLWSIFWFFLFFIWVWLIISIFGDIIRSDMSGMSKAVWTIGIILLPYLGIFMYLIVNGSEMTQRSVDAANRQQAAADEYIRSVAGTGPSAELKGLADLHSSGGLTDAEYEQAKAKVLGG